MKVTVKEANKTDNGGLTKWQTVVSQDHQHFTICERYDKDECLWFAKMFRKALREHDKIQRGKK
jgi:hypothetical protein